MTASQTTNPRAEWASVARERARERALGAREAKLEAILKDVRDALAAPGAATDRIANAQVFLEWMP